MCGKSFSATKMVVYRQFCGLGSSMSKICFKLQPRNAVTYAFLILWWFHRPISTTFDKSTWIIQISQETFISLCTYTFQPIIDFWKQKQMSSSETSGTLEGASLSMCIYYESCRNGNRVCWTFSARGRCPSWKKTNSKCRTETEGTVPSGKRVLLPNDRVPPQIFKIYRFFRQLVVYINYHWILICDVICIWKF